MYGAILGDLAGFPCENHPVDLTDRNLPLIRMPEEENENTFSDKTVLTTALEEGLLCFERRMPEILAGKRDQMFFNSTAESAYRFHSRAL